jgi:hypothetical protein
VFRSISSKPCHYCGSDPKPRYSKYRKSDVTPYLCNGIDRVDNGRGYVLSNCVSCCGLCNYMKRSLPRQKFLDHIQKISSYPEVKDA